MSARLPVPGSDSGQWGDILNAFLLVSHASDGTILPNSVASAGAEVLSNKGQSNGYAPLNGSAQISSSYLPIGTASGTVAAGNDNRFLVSRQSVIVLSGSASSQIATVGGWTPTYLTNTDTNNFVGWVNISDGTQNDSISFDFVANAGTHTLEFFHLPFQNRGIYTLQIDGVTIGTVDGYKQSLNPTRAVLTGITIATTGQHTLTVLIASKNASATGYLGMIDRAILTQTA
jgi:hypothetical protein